MTEATLAAGYPIDVQRLMVTRLLVQATSGNGKSYALRRILEQTAPHVQQFIIDPEGEFASLRERFDYVICAAEGGDARADPRTAKQLAHKLLEAGVSAVFDIYELDPDDRTLFVSRFCRAMVEAPKRLWRPCLVVIDEAQDFAPERGSKKRSQDDQDATPAIIALTAKGRKRGFTICCATQRLSRFNKDVAAELQNKLLGGAGLPIDVKANAVELGMSARDGQAIFPRLAPGEFYAFGPAFTREPTKIKIGPVQTTHPEAGSLSKISPPAPSGRVLEVLGQLSDLPPAHDKETDAETLRAEISRLRSELERSPAASELNTAHERGRREGLEQGYRAAESTLRGRMQQIMNAGERFLEELRESAAVKLGEAPTNGQAVTPSQPRPPAVTRREHLPKPNTAPPRSDLTPASQRTLDAVAWWERIGIDDPTSIQLRIIAGYSPRSGTFDQIRGKLRAEGLVEYGDGGTTFLTAAGRAQANAPAGAGTLDEFHGAIISKLDRAEERMLRILLEQYPEPVPNADLREQSGYSPRSGTFDQVRAKLSKMSLVEYQPAGHTRATSLLFPEQLR